jgi:hypothetical protein
MRVSTLVEYRFVNGQLEPVREEGFEYTGPVALAGRSESKQVVNQGTAQSAQDQQAAQSSLAAANKSITGYNQNLDDFMKFGRRTYSPTGEFMRDANTLATTTAAAGSNKIAGDTALNAMRTGENTANAAPALAESTRSASRDLTSQLAGADTTRLQDLTNINQFGVQASALPAQVQASLYGTGTSGSGSQLSTAGDAAKTPGFFDTFLPALVGGAATAAGGYFTGKGKSGG